MTKANGSRPSLPSPPQQKPKKLGKESSARVTQPREERRSSGATGKKLRFTAFAQKETALPPSRSPNRDGLSVPFPPPPKKREKRNRGQEELRVALGEERPPGGRGGTDDSRPSSATKGVVWVGGGRKSRPASAPGDCRQELLQPHLGSVQPPSDSGGQHGWSRESSGRRTRPRSLTRHTCGSTVSG